MRKAKYNRKRVYYDAKRFSLVGVPYPIALKEAWRAEKFRVLKQMLATGLVEFSFKQAGAQMQKLTGTTMPHAIPIVDRTPVKHQFPYVRVYDTKLHAWQNINTSTADIQFA